MLTEIAPAPVEPVSVGELKAYLRLDGSAEDAVLAGFIRTARTMCEAFTGVMLVVRGFRETVAAIGRPRRLSAAPLVGVDAVEKLDQGGAAAAVDGWKLSYRDDGSGAIEAPATDGPLRITYRAGIADDWNGVPEALRQGIIRLAAHLYSYRDDPGDKGPPAAVAALWRPWRRLRLG